MSGFEFYVIYTLVNGKNELALVTENIIVGRLSAT